MAQPCTPWITGDDVAECCSVETTTASLFDTVATTASSILFQLSGRQFPGECGPKTVRPPCLGCTCGYQVLSRGYVIGPWNYGNPLAGLCDLCLVACEPSRVKLSGYPVREIEEVLIDGDVVSPTLYTLYNRRYVTRLDNGRWPIQQNLTLADTEDHTFAITYTYGADPPQEGKDAAAQLACELYKACNSQSCSLPAGVIRETRQGVTIDRVGFTNWAYTPARFARSTRVPGWNTGLSLVDAFLNAHNSAGLQRRPVIWSPGKRQYAQGFG